MKPLSGKQRSELVRLVELDLKARLHEFYNPEDVLPVVSFANSAGLPAATTCI